MIFAIRRISKGYNLFGTLFIAFDPRFFSRDEKERGEKSRIQKEASYILLTIDILIRNVMQLALE